MSEEKEGLKIVEWDEGLGFKYGKDFLGTFRATFEIEKLKEWRVQIIVEHKSGSTHVSGLTVIPRDPDNPPSGGFSTTELRKIPISSLLSHARRHITKELKVFKNMASPALVNEIEKAARSIITTKRPGSAGRDNFAYVALVVEYQNALDAGSKKPIDVLAEKYNLAHTTVRNMLQEARMRGLAESKGLGRLGWKLTEKGNQILNRKGK